MTKAQEVPADVPKVEVNGVELVPAQFDWGTGANRRARSASAVEVLRNSISIDPSGDITFAVFSAGLPTMSVISAFTELNGSGQPLVSSEVRFDCQVPKNCNWISDKGVNYLQIRVPDAKLFVLRVSYQEFAIQPASGPIGAPQTASWVVEVIH